jgi:hypothetical protein
LLQFIKPIVGNQVRKAITQMNFYVMIVVVLEVGKGTKMKKYKNGNDF